jgi:DNA polymerase III subunit epsilon
MGLLDLLRRRRRDVPAEMRSPAPIRVPDLVRPSAGFAVLDVETTGLSPREHRIVEIAVVRTDPAGRPVGEWVRRLNPDGPVGATHVHGITDADVAGAPRFGEVLPELNGWLAGAAVVAHNAGFDLAFLRAEYAYQGWTLPRLPALCTLEASDHYLPALDRRRLSDCCAAARIRHEGAHSALGDARATAALLAHYLGARGGVPPRPADLDLVRLAGVVRWPAGPTRRPQTPATRAVVLRRVEVATSTPVRPPAPRLVELLGDFSLTDALDEGARPGTLPYLEKLAEVLEDGVLTAEEAAGLDDVAHAYGLSADDRAGAHRGLLLALCHLALDDGRVSRAERAELTAMAALLGLDGRLVTRTLDRAEAARHTRLGAGLRPLPPDWAHGEPLRVGDKVVFTGCDEHLRRRLEARAEQLGVRVLGGVSRRTAMLVTDGTFAGTKAGAAAELGVRTVPPETFEVLLRHLQPAAARRPAPAAAAVPAGVAVPAGPAAGRPDPAIVRRWARTNGYEVGDRGRLPAELYEAYAAATGSAG